MNEIVPNNQFVAALLKNQDFWKGLNEKLGQDLSKADTISQATNLLWYDLRPIVQMLYPFKELIPRISRLPRVPADGGNAYHWKRIVAINVNQIAIGVSEGNRGARIAITEQDMVANYKTLGLESSATFQARWGAKNLDPEALGIAVQSTLRSLMIGEEQTLILGDASTPLGLTPTPVLATTGSTGNWGGTVTVYVICVALAGFGFLNNQAYNASTNAGGIPGQITRMNADGSTDTYGGGSAQPSAEASIGSVGTSSLVQASVTPVVGAVAYAWFVGTTSGAETLAGVTAAARATFSKVITTGQPVANLKVGGTYQDNSTNVLLPDGILSQVYGAVLGPAPGTTMSTNSNLPTLTNGVISLSPGGSIVCTMNQGNAGLTITGTNIAEFDAILQAAYDQYKIGFSRILMSSVDINQFLGTFFGQNANNTFRILFDAEAETGRIIAGRRVTSYLNKFFGNTLDIEIHPFMPPGQILFWSDSIPYELSGVANVLEAHVRQDYYQLQWPFRTMRYEFGCYCDEVFSCYFTPAFAMITNLNPAAGTPGF